MNAAAVSRVLSLIPERTARPLSGTVFTDEEAARAQHADRMQYVARFLSWLTPLNPITKDDQRFLGLLATHVRPVHAAVEDAGDELDAAADGMDEGAEEGLYEDEPVARPSLGAERTPEGEGAGMTLASVSEITDSGARS